MIKADAFRVRRDFEGILLFLLAGVVIAIVTGCEMRGQLTFKQGPAFSKRFGSIPGALF